MEKVILLGAGGHCKSVISALDQSKFEVVGIYDNTKEKGYLVDKYSVLGSDEDIPTASPNCHYAFITVGMLTSAKIRIKLSSLLTEKGYELINVIDKSALVHYEMIGVGNFIGKGCILNEVKQIGNNNIINTGAIIEHDTVIGNFNHIAPGTTICGEVVIGNECLVGAGATIIQQQKVKNNTIIPAGTTVR